MNRYERDGRRNRDTIGRGKNKTVGRKLCEIERSRGEDSNRVWKLRKKMKMGSEKNQRAEKDIETRRVMNNLQEMKEAHENYFKRLLETVAWRMDMKRNNI